MAEEKESMVSMPDGWPVSFSLPKYPASRKEETLEFVDGDEISKTGMHHCNRGLVCKLAMDPTFSWFVVHLLDQI
jgi:hypothetical protein